MTDPMTPDREQDIRAREQAATPGPWGTSRDLEGTYTIKHGTRVTLQAGFDSDGDVAVLTGDDQTAYRNGAFTAYARQDIPALLAEIDRLRAEVDKVQRQYTYDTAELKKANDQLHADRDAAVAAAVRRALDDAAEELHMDWGGPDHEDGMDEARKQLRAQAAAAAGPAREKASPVDWEAIARQRERELKAAGEARHRAEVERDAVRRHADPCDGNCGTTILECAVANDVEPPARVQDAARQPDEERRARYAAAIQRRVVQGYTLTSILPEVYEAADAAMAVADAEQAAAVRRALDDAAEVAVHAARACGGSETSQYAASVAASIGLEIRARAAVAGPARERGAADAAALRRLLPKMTELRGRLKSSQDPAASGVSLAMQLVQVLSDAAEAGEEW